MKYLSLSIILFITSCSSQSFSDKAADQIIEAISNKYYSRNPAECLQIKKQCSSSNDHYDEWIQKNGQKGCACN